MVVVVKVVLLLNLVIMMVMVINVDVTCAQSPCRYSARACCGIGTAHRRTDP